MNIKKFNFPTKKTTFKREIYNYYNRYQRVRPESEYLYQWRMRESYGDVSMYLRQWI